MEMKISNMNMNMNGVIYMQEKCGKHVYMCVSYFFVGNGIIQIFFHRFVWFGLRVGIHK